MLQPNTLRYRAFLSYSHTTAAWTNGLHRALEGFRIDRDLIGRETANGVIPATLRPIFRDRGDFTAGLTLADQTLAALDASAALIVVCSPAAAKSRNVNEEVRLFRARHPHRPIVPVIVDGEPGDADRECFPPALRFEVGADGRVTDTPSKMLAADARREGDGRDVAVAKIVARLLGVRTDEIFRRAERERRQQLRRRNAIIAVLASLSLVALASAYYWRIAVRDSDAFAD